MSRVIRLGLLVVTSTAMGCLYPSLKTVTDTPDAADGFDGRDANTADSGSGGDVGVPDVASVTGTGGTTASGGVTTTGDGPVAGGTGGIVAGGISGGSTQAGTGGITGSGGSSGSDAASGGGGLTGTGGVVGMGGTMGAGGTSGAGMLSILAGVPSGRGTADGKGAAARFNAPHGVAVDGAGNLFITEGGNRTIREITPSGVVTTLAGSATEDQGSADGTRAAARFHTPSCVAVDGAGNLFITDSGNNTIRKITPSGVVTTLAGSGTEDWGSADGTGDAARFNQPRGVAVDGSGNLFVADSMNHTIRKITSDGVVTTFAGSAGSAGLTDGIGSAARFSCPDGVALDGASNVFVTDTCNSNIRKITPSGVVTTLAGGDRSGKADGAGAAAGFWGPDAVAVDGAGNVFVAEFWNNTIRRITPSGVVTTLAGTAGKVGSTDGTGADARFNGLSGLAMDGAGNLFVADTDNNTIRSITPNGVVSTFAGAARSVGTADGVGAAARFSYWDIMYSRGPQGVAVDGAGNAFVADADNNTIRKITPGGVVTTLAGSAGYLGSADGTGSAALFSGLRGLAVDGSGNVFVADFWTVRKVTPAGVVTTLAGAAASRGSVDGTGADARFSDPQGVAVDGAGNVFVAEGYTNIIRKITPAGVVTTLAGTADSSGSADGTGAAARFNRPAGVAVDRAGNVFVTDSFPTTIRKITPGGAVTTLAVSEDGTGKPAQLAASALAVDGAGNIFVADGGTAIRKITPAGAVTTIVGVAGSVSAGNFPGPLPASIVSPNGVAIDPSNSKLYITLPDAVMVAALPN